MDGLEPAHRRVEHGVAALEQGAASQTERGAGEARFGRSLQLLRRARAVLARALLRSEEPLRQIGLPARPGLGARGCALIESCALLLFFAAMRSAVSVRVRLCENNCELSEISGHLHNARKRIN